LRNAISEKLKFSKTAIHQAVARFKTFVSFLDLNRSGRPKVASQSEKDGSALTHHFE